MAHLEIGHEVGAGLTAIDPVSDEDAEGSDESRLALGRFVSLARRGRGMSIDALAELAEVDVGELLSIERDAHHLPGFWRETQGGGHATGFDVFVCQVDHHGPRAFHAERLELLHHVRVRAPFGSVGDLSENRRPLDMR